MIWIFGYILIRRLPLLLVLCMVSTTKMIRTTLKRATAAYPANPFSPCGFFLITLITMSDHDIRCYDRFISMLLSRIARSADWPGSVFCSPFKTEFTLPYRTVPVVHTNFYFSFQRSVFNPLSGRMETIRSILPHSSASHRSESSSTVQYLARCECRRS